MSVGRSNGKPKVQKHVAFVQGSPNQNGSTIWFGFRTVLNAPIGFSMAHDEADISSIRFIIIEFLELSQVEIGLYYFPYYRRQHYSSFRGDST